MSCAATAWNTRTLFQEGELVYTGRKGGNILAEKTLGHRRYDHRRGLSAVPGTGVGNPGIHRRSELIRFHRQINAIPGESGTLNAGGGITSDGRLRIVSNNGTGNAVTYPVFSISVEAARRDNAIAQPRILLSSGSGWTERRFRFHRLRYAGYSAECPPDHGAWNHVTVRRRPTAGLPTPATMIRRGPTTRLPYGHGIDFVRWRGEPDPGQQSSHQYRPRRHPFVDTARFRARLLAGLRIRCRTE